jgi:C4-type Zn-finger protein
MPAIAEIPPTAIPRSAARGRDLPICPVCADTMIAAEASAYISDSVISHLWSCDTCGYGFVTKHVVQRIACN